MALEAAESSPGPSWGRKPTVNGGQSRYSADNHNGRSTAIATVMAAGPSMAWQGVKAWICFLVLVAVVRQRHPRWPCRSQQSFTVRSGQPTDNANASSTCAVPYLRRWQSYPIWLWEQGSRTRSSIHNTAHGNSLPVTHSSCEGWRHTTVTMMSSLAL
jgi:hypothetical protein